MRPRDLAKVGQVMLNDGVWNGARYLPAEYIEQLRTAPAPEANPSYGLFWHLNAGDYYLSYRESNFVRNRLLPGTPRDRVRQLRQQRSDHHGGAESGSRVGQNRSADPVQHLDPRQHGCAALGGRRRIGQEGVARRAATGAHVPAPRRGASGPRERPRGVRGVAPSEGRGRNAVQAGASPGDLRREARARLNPDVALPIGHQIHRLVAGQRLTLPVQPAVPDRDVDPGGAHLHRLRPVEPRASPGA